LPDLPREDPFVQPVALAHTTFAVASLVLGAVVLSLTKGTERHRVLGMLYVLSMFGLNVTALSIYRLFGGFGVFHALAVLSLAGLLAGFAAAFLKRPRHAWLEYHYLGMGWSYVGLCAAAAAEAAVRVPGVPFGAGVTVSTLVVSAVGGTWVHARRHSTLARVGREQRASPRHGDRQSPRDAS
jgi:uncharacterized membrane protein